MCSPGGKQRWQAGCTQSAVGSSRSVHALTAASHSLGQLFVSFHAQRLHESEPSDNPDGSQQKETAPVATAALTCSASRAPPCSESGWSSSLPFLSCSNPSKLKRPECSKPLTCSASRALPCSASEWSGNPGRPAGGGRAWPPPTAAAWPVNRWDTRVKKGRCLARRDWPPPTAAAWTVNTRNTRVKNRSIGGAARGCQVLHCAGGKTRRSALKPASCLGALLGAASRHT